MLPALLATAGLALAAPSAADWFLGLPERYGSDTWSRSRKSLRSAMTSSLTDSSFEGLEMETAIQKQQAERGAIERMKSYGHITAPRDSRERAIEDQFLLSQIGRDFGQEIARISRTTSPSMMEIAARMGIDMGGPA